MLLDWCQDTPLKHKSLPGLGNGLVAAIRRRFLSIMNTVLASKLNVPADMFCETYYPSHLIYRDFRMEKQGRLLEWAVERFRCDVGFASTLGFVPAGGADDGHRLREHLHSRQSSKSRTTSSHSMIRPEMM